MKKKIWGVLLSVAVLVTTVNFPATAGAEEDKGGADASGIVVKVSDDMNGSNANESDEIQTVQISAQNQSNMDAVVRIFLLNEDKETADTEVEIPNLCDKDQITDETVQTEMAETLKSALTLESGTNSALDAQWIEKKDDSGNVTAKYLEAALPAGTAAAFDMQLMYRTDEENYTKKTIVRAKAFVDEQDVTKASDVEDEDNEAEVKWEVVKVEEESEAGSAEIERLEEQTTEEKTKETPMPVKSRVAKAGTQVLNPEYVYLDPKGMTLENNDWTKSNTIVFMIVEDWGSKQKASFDSSTGYWYWNATDWDNTDKSFYFTIDANNTGWENEGNYSRTANLSVNLTNAKGKIFSWHGSSSMNGNYKVYELEEGAAFNPDDHTQFAGETMWLQNNSGTSLSEVKAVFYEKNDDGTLAKVDTIQMEKRGDDAFTVQIPDKACSYVQFINSDNVTVLGDTYSNFYGQGESENGVRSFLFNKSNMYCYLYGGSADTSEWGSRTGGTTIYFDAALSKLSYVSSANNDAGDVGIPNSSGKIFYHAYSSTDILDYEDGEMQKLSEKTIGSNSWKDVYSVTLKKQYDCIIFYTSSALNTWPAANSPCRTEDLIIDWSKDKPCFYADDSDDAGYKTAARSGYWNEVYTIRDPEDENTTDGVVDIPSATFTRKTDMLYVNTTLYDFYSDYELNGNNRDDYDSTENINSHRIYQPFRQFNQALSEYYRLNKVNDPMYWGNFQNYDGNKFTEISNTMDLFGFGSDISSNESSDDYHKFFYLHHSMWQRNGTNFNSYPSVPDAQTGKVATQGLASQQLADDSLMMNTTDGTSIPAPFFDQNFLEGNNSKNTVLGKVYENVTFPFVKKQLGSLSAGDDNKGTKYGTVDYWYFNSDNSELSELPENANLRLYRDGENRYFLDSAGTQDSDGVKGEKPEGPTSETQYFPLNDTEQSGNAALLNYGFGQKFEISFRLTEDGMVKTSKGKDVPIEFNFSGDDDVWVYVDGELVLDIGGGHGKVTGRIDFANKVSYVSAVKNDDSTYGGATADVRKAFPDGLKNDKDFYNKEHTLTMFYMERGLWESNLRLSFNFPDENQFQVEKKVDDSDMNEIFKAENLGYDLFESQSVFPFVIENQATHYKETDVKTDESAPEPKVYNDTFASGTLEQPSGGGGGITWQHEGEKDGKRDVVHWHASGSDTTGEYKEQRWGIIKPGTGNSFDASEQDAYLRFSLYFDDDTTPTLNNMYLELEDESGNKLSGYLSGKTYGNASLTQKAWNTIQVDLSKMDKIGGDFDFSRIKNIKFSYNLDKNIYLDDFTFIPPTTVSGETGFTTAQVDIPSYGSVGTGTLMYPEGAVYALSGNGSDTTNRIGSDGMFALADGQTATFSDQFRRGSYIALSENVNTDLFDTTWTLYENGAPVKEIKDGRTVNTENKVSSLENVSGTTLRDGRQEEYQSGENSNGEISNVGYTQTGWAKNRDKTENTNTIVFRSYANPDNTTVPTKLKAVFTNKVKTGSIVIQKKTDDENTVLQGKYTFTVMFTNIAGLGLEKAPITKDYTINLGDGDTSNYEIRIDGIPAGTVYQITEKGTDDGSVLEKADFFSNNMESDKGYSNETKTVEGKMVVFGTEKDESKTPQICTEEDAEAVVQFYNTLKKTIDITVEKKWEQMPDDVQYPESIKAQLQRRETDADEWKPADYEGTGNNYVTINQDYEGNWKYDFEGLEQFADSPTNSKPYQYRIVELDEHNNVIETEDYLNNLFKVTYSDDYLSVTAPASDTPNDYTITNTYNPEGTVKIIKENGEGDSLEGAEFALYTTKDGNKIATDSKGKDLKGTTGSEGELIFDNIPAGTKDKPKPYYLKELKTAAGYVLLKEPIEVTLPYEYHKGDIVNGKEVTDAGMTWSLTYTIVNDKAFDLPASGLRGIGPIAAAGIAIVVIAGAVFAARNIKGQRAASNRRKHRPH